MAPAREDESSPAAPAPAKKAKPRKSAKAKPAQPPSVEEPPVGQPDLTLEQLQPAAGEAAPADKPVTAP